MTSLAPESLAPPPDRRIGRKRRRKATPALSAQELCARLAEDPLLAKVSAADIEALVKACAPRSFALGEVILRQGEIGRGLFVLSSGRVRIVDESDPSAPVTLVARGAGALFGERGLLLDSPVGATVRAATPATALVLDPDGFRALLRQRPAIGQAMRAAITRYDRFNALRRQQVFQNLPETDLYGLLDEGEWISLAPGAPLEDEGVAQDGVWLIWDGILSAVTRASASDDPQPASEPPPEIALGLRRAGTLHGLPRFLDPTAPPVRLTAEQPSTLIRWSAEVFRARLAADPGALEMLHRIAALEQQRLSTLIAGDSFEDTADRSTRSESGPILVRDGTREVRLWPAQSAQEDGMAALRTAAALLGRPLTELRPPPGATVAPDSLAMLAIRAESAGLVSRLLRTPLTRLSPPMLPFLFEGPDGRIKAAIRLDRQRLHYADPATGTIAAVPRSEAEGWWKGAALSLAMVPDFAGVGSARVSMVTRFLPMLWPHRHALMQLAALAVLGLLLGLAMPLVLGVIIDHVLVFEDMGLLLLMMTAIIVASAIAMAADAAAEFLSLRALNMMSASLMARFLSHVLAVPLDRLQKWRSGDLAAAFEENENIFGIAVGLLTSLVFDLLSLLLFGSALFLISPGLAVLVMGLAVLIGGIMVAASSRLRAYEIQEFEAGRDLQSHIIETFDGIESLKFASREAATTRRGVGMMQHSARVGVASARFSFRLEMLIELIGVIASLGVLAIGGGMVVDGQMTAGTLVAFSGMVGGVMGPLSNLAGVYDEVQELRVSFERVNEVLDLPREPDGQAPAPRLQGEIRFEGLGFAYEPGKPVLSNVTLTIPAGKKVAFVGPSGSGKSTLIRMVNRLLTPTEGRILIDGLDVAQVEPASLRRQIGTVEQVPHIFAGTIRENIAKAFPDMGLERVATAARLTGAADFIEALPMAYATRVGEGGRALSGGQSQRLVIARAIAGDPRILILDEATSALDAESEAAVQRALDGAMAGRTVIAVAHRLSTIRNADMIVALEAGQIVETGTHEELRSAGGLYQRLLEASAEEDAPETDDASDDPSDDDTQPDTDPQEDTPDGRG